MLRDAELFRSRLSKLDGAADVGDYVVNVVKSKVVIAEKAAVPENKPPSITEASSMDTTSSSEMKPSQDGEKT